MQGAFIYNAAPPARTPVGCHQHQSLTQAEAGEARLPHQNLLIAALGHVFYSLCTEGDEASSAGCLCL